MEKLTKLIKILGYVDYAVSVGVLAFGIYQQSWIYIAVGIFGLAIAYLKPAERVKGALTKKFIRRPNPSADVAPEEAYPPPPAPVRSASYQARTRYAGTAYYVGYKDGRLPVAHAHDLVLLLYLPKRMSGIGLRAEKIVPRDKK